MGKYIFKPDKYSSHMKIIRYLKSFRPQEKLTVLDVACSKGFIGEYLKKSRFSFYGLEFNGEDARIAKKHYEKVVIIDLDNQKVDLPRKKFDVIIFADIIEHLKRSQLILSDFSPFLKDDGVIIVSTSNIANLYIRLQLLLGKFDYQERGILDNTHVRLFTLKTFRQLVIQSGYKIEKEDFTPIPLPLVNKNFSHGK